MAQKTVKFLDKKGVIKTPSKIKSHNFENKTRQNNF